LIKFTDDPYVIETLKFLMTREIAHYQMFEAALDTIKPNFPPGVVQGDPRFSNTYFNMSNGSNIRGPWNEGKSTGLGENWQYIADPIKHVIETEGLTLTKPEGTSRTEESTEEHDKALGNLRSNEINESMPMSDMQWSTYPEHGLKRDKKEKQVK
jgi:Mn-containing catalase